VPGYAAATDWSFGEEDALTTDAALARADAAAPTATDGEFRERRHADGLAEELKALRDKAERICAELAALYRRMDDLQEQIRVHQEG